MVSADEFEAHRPRLFGIVGISDELVKIRASQLNGCAYCIDMHTKEARAAGETEQRIYTPSAWRETPFFTDRERAALALTEAVTFVHGGQVPTTSTTRRRSTSNSPSSRRWCGESPRSTRGTG